MKNLMAENNMKVGDKVYVVFNDTRREPFYTTIKSIGRKYITIDNIHYTESKYDIVTKESVDDCNGHNCKATLYESEQAYIEKQKEIALRKDIARSINIDIHSLSIEKLKRILSIINEKD